MKAWLSPSNNGKDSVIPGFLSNLGRRKVLPGEMVWECECPLGGCKDMLPEVLGRLAEPGVVQALWEEICSVVLELGTGCGSGNGAAAITLGCSEEPAFWHWSSKLDGGGCPLHLPCLCSTSLCLAQGLSLSQVPAGKRGGSCGGCHP